MFQKFSPEKYFPVSALGSVSFLQTYAWWLSVWILWTSARDFSNCQKCRLPNIWQGYMAMNKVPKIYKVPITTLDSFPHISHFLIFSLLFLLTFSLCGIWVYRQYVNHSLIQQMFIVHFNQILIQVFVEQNRQQRRENHYTPIRVAKIWNTDNTKCWHRCGATEIPMHCWSECKVALYKRIWSFLQN